MCSSYPINLFTINSSGHLITGDVIPSSFSVILMVIVATDNAVPPNQDVTMAVVNFPLPTSMSTSLPIPTSPQVVTARSEQQQSNGYLIALIVIGVGGGVLFLIVIALLIFVCRK